MLSAAAAWERRRRPPLLRLRSLSLLLLLVVVGVATVGLGVQGGSVYDGSSLQGSLKTRIGSTQFATRLFHASGSVGYRSSANGESEAVRGAIFEVRNDADVHKVLDGDQISADLLVMLPARFFNASIVDLLRKTEWVKGFMLLTEETDAEENAVGQILADWSGGTGGGGGGGGGGGDAQYSEDVATPQGADTPQGNVFTEVAVGDGEQGADHVWNTYGNGLAYADRKFPIVQLDADGTTKLRRLAKKNRKSGYDRRPLHVAKLRYYFGPSDVDSKDCLEWRDIYDDADPRCLPIGGQSVWATATTLDDSRPVVLATTGIDSNGVIRTSTRAANDVVSSVTAMLAAADALSRYPNRENLPKQIMFGLFQAEEWGFVGSRRFAQDLYGFECAAAVHGNDTDSGLPLCTDPALPNTLMQHIPADRLSEIVAVDQVGVGSELFVQYNASSATSTSMATELASAAASAGVTVTPATNASRALPPTPFTAFHRYNRSVNGIVLSGYDSRYADPLWHTRYDNASRLDMDLISDAATTIAASLLSLAGGNVSATPAVNETVVRLLVHCLTTDWRCDFMADYVRSEDANMEDELGGSVSFHVTSTPPTYYAGPISATNRGLPVVQHGSSVRTKYSGTFDRSADAVYVIPNYFEVFLRTFLEHSLGSRASTSGEGNETCVVSSDCSDTCSILSYSTVQMDCIRSECICPNAFYHTALDPGLAAKATPNEFSVLGMDEAPIFTEPYWSDTYMKVFESPGSSIGYVAISLGGFLTVFFGAAIHIAATVLTNQNLL